MWRESERPERPQGLLEEARGRERAARAQLDTALAALDAREEQVRRLRAPGAPAAPRGPRGGRRHAPGAGTHGRSCAPPPPFLPRTNRTRLVPAPVLTGHTGTHGRGCPK